MGYQLHELACITSRFDCASGTFQTRVVDTLRAANNTRSIGSGTPLGGGVTGLIECISYDPNHPCAITNSSCYPLPQRWWNPSLRVISHTQGHSHPRGCTDGTLTQTYPSVRTGPASQAQPTPHPNGITPPDLSHETPRMSITRRPESTQRHTAQPDRASPVDTCIHPDQAQ